jgi:hypothetical protein
MIKRYFVTYVTKNNKIISDYNFGIQIVYDPLFGLVEPTPGKIAKQLFEIINSVNNNCQAIINFWELKSENLEDNL